MKSEERYPTGPENGVLTYGLFLEGARWEKTEHALAESLPKVLFSLAPTMHWVPYRRADVPQYPHYKCPVYKTSDRRYVLLLLPLVYTYYYSIPQYVAVFLINPHPCCSNRGILATTGHSSNFVCFINMPSPLCEDHWVERGVAMLTQLDD